MALIKISQSQDSPLPCAVHLELGACRQVAVSSAVGLLEVMLCPACYDEALTTGTFKGKPIVESWEFVTVDSNDQGYIRWLKERSGNE